MQPKPNLPLGPNIIHCPNCQTQKEVRQWICPNCGIRSCPKGHIVNRSARICHVCGEVDHQFKQSNTTAGSPVTRSHKSQYLKPEYTCPQCQRIVGIMLEMCPHCGALLGNLGRQEIPPSKAAETVIPSGKTSPVIPDRQTEEVFSDISDTSAYYCEVCKTNTPFISGKCTVCGNLLDTALYDRSYRQADNIPTRTVQPTPPKQRETFAAGQPAEPVEGEGVYVCPICRTANDKFTSKCPVCGYIGSMQYEHSVPNTIERTVEPTRTPPIEQPPREGIIFPKMEHRASFSGKAEIRPAPDEPRQDFRDREPFTEKVSIPSSFDDTSRTIIDEDLVMDEEKGSWFAGFMSVLNKLGSVRESRQNKTAATFETEIAKEKFKEWKPAPEPVIKKKKSRPKLVRASRSKAGEWPFAEKIKPSRSLEGTKKGLKITGGVLVSIIVLAAAGFGIFSLLNNRPLPSVPSSPATTTTETNAPLINNIAESSITEDGIMITWQTDLPATGQVEYGTSSGYGYKSRADTELSTEHSVTLNGLSAEETYHYRVISTDADGNETISPEDRIFTTLAPPDTTPPVIAKLTVTALDTSAVVSWNTDEPTTGQVEYGSTVDLGSTMQSDETGSLQHRIVISGLRPQTTYHFLVKSTDTQKNETVSDQDRFTTLAPIETGIEVGDRAPDFTLGTFTGGTVTLSALQGKLVMVTFWTTACGACVAEMPDIQAAYEAWSGEKELEVLPVNAKQPDVYIQRFLDERAWCTIPIVVDSDGAVAREYHITRIPRTFFIDETGVIRKVQAGRFQNKEEIMSILDELD